MRRNLQGATRSFCRKRIGSEYRVQRRHLSSRDRHSRSGAV